MTSARSYKNPEKTWFLEMLRRCKALPVLIAVAYFLSNILPILLAYNKLEKVISYVVGSMTGANLLNMGIGIAGGIIVSCAVFKYLHSTDSVIDAHSKPMTRTQLFRGSFFAGLILVIAPVVLTGLFYLCMSGAHYSGNLEAIMKNWDMLDWMKENDVAHILSASNILGWTLDNIIVIGFTYCVACFAAILAGTAAIQALLSLVLISVSAIVYSFILGYMNAFLYGYNSENAGGLLMYLSPYSYLMMRGTRPFLTVPVTLIVYIVISVLIVFAAVAIYKKIKLENEEQTVVVPYVAEFLVVLLTAIAVSVVLFIARSFLSVDTTVGAIITIILATIVFFPIFCMISEQSFRIFKKKNVGVLVVYAAVMCLVLAFTLFDVTGFEKRVPEVSDVASVNIVDYNLVKSDVNNMSDEETLALITDLHRSIAEAGNQSSDDLINPEVVTADGKSTCISGITLEYKLKNGKKLSRYYPSIYADSYESYSAYYTGDKIRKHECIDAEHPLIAGQYMALNDAHVDDEGNLLDMNVYMVPDDEVANIVKAANADIIKWTPENRGLYDYVEEYDPAKDISAYTLDISVDYRIPSVKATELENYTSYYAFTTKDKNFVKYVEEHPELKSDKNIIPSDSPIFGRDEEE